NHLPDQLGKGRFWPPAKLLPRLAGVANQKIDFGRTEIHGIDAQDGLARLAVDTGLVDALAAPFDGATDLGKRQLDELAHRTGLAGGQHEIVGRVRLQYPVHALDIIPRMAPVALGFEIAQIEGVFQTGLNPRDTARDLARHKGLAADWALVVEQ